MPPPTLEGAASPAAMRAVGSGGVDPGEAGMATQIAALPEFGGFVKATSPLSFRKAVAPGNTLMEVTLLADCGLHGPVAAIGISVKLPSLPPTNRPAQRPKSIWP